MIDILAKTCIKVAIAVGISTINKTVTTTMSIYVVEFASLDFLEIWNFSEKIESGV